MRNEERGKNSWDKTRLLIESIVAIAIAVFSAYIGIRYGKSTNNAYFYNGQNMSEAELNQIMEDNAEYKAAYDYLKVENEQLSSRVSELVNRNLSLEEENQKLLSENEELQFNVSALPTLEFRDCGLSVNGDEIPLNKDRSYVEINGRQYFSMDFVDSLLPEGTITTLKGEMLFIGKIIKEKVSLLDLKVIKNSGYEIWDNIIDTYGNTYSNVLYFKDSGNGITYNAERAYSRFKCVAAMKTGGKGRRYIQVETDDPEYTYISPEINNLTEAFEIDIPINNTSTITIKCVNGSWDSYIFISNPTLYNQE